MDQSTPEPVTTPDGRSPLILTPKQYFEVGREISCPHPQGYPCTSACEPYPTPRDGS